MTESISEVSIIHDSILDKAQGFLKDLHVSFHPKDNLFVVTGSTDYAYAQQLANSGIGCLCRNRGVDIKNEISFRT